MNTVTVVAVRVGEEPKVIELERGLEAWKEFVGGWIEQLSNPLVPGVDLICNEEGKLMGLEPNVHLGFDVIAGNCFFTSNPDEEGEAQSLSYDAAQATLKALEGRLVGIRRPYGSEEGGSGRGA